MKWLSCLHLLWTRGSPYKCHAHNNIHIYNIMKVPSAIEESESAGSRWELNTGPLGCPAGALSLSYDNQTTTGLHNPLYAWCVQLRHFSTTCAVHIEDCEGLVFVRLLCSVAEHWLHKPAWVQFQATVSLFTFSHFTSKYLSFISQSKSSKQHYNRLIQLKEDICT